MNDIGIPNYNNLMLDSKYKDRNSVYAAKARGLLLFYVPKIKIRGWVNLYNFSYNENFGKFTKFCQDTFLNSFYTLAKWQRNLLIFLGPHSFMLPENLITVNGLPKL